MNEEIEQIVNTNTNHLENILYYSYENFLKNDYSIILQKIMMTTKTLGVKAKQQVDAFTYKAKDTLVSQSYTSSRYINEFTRFYDENNEIRAYITSNINDIKKQNVNPVILTYDEYILKYGKLFKGKYYIKKPLRISDFTLNDNYSYEKCDDDLIRYGIIIYEINDYSYKKAELIKKGKNYLLSFILDPLVSHRFYSKQITNTGHLTTEPIFVSSKISFLLDSNLHLISSNCNDIYKAKFGLLNLDIESETNYYFFNSNSNKFSNGKKVLNISFPKINEVDFEGFKLIK